MKFSVVIPSYNRASLILNTIQSVLLQTYQTFEIIVVDDGGTDNTGDLVKGLNHPKVSYFYKINEERAAARNFGAAKATGDYIVFLDSDDELYPNHLQVAKEFIEAHPNVEIFHLRYDIKNAEKVKVSEGPVFNKPPNKKLICGNFLSCNGVFLRTDIALKHRFNEDRDLSAVEDWDLWLRLSILYPIHYINTITSSIINHENRSVLAVNKEKQVKRMELFLQYTLANKDITGKYSAELYKLQASCYSYISLHLALNKVYRKDAIKYLLKSLKIKPSFVFEKRFIGILKHLI